MAKAREQIADEAHTAEEVEKDAWRQGETKRVEEMVRALSEILSITPLLIGAVYTLITRGSFPCWLCSSLSYHWQVRQEYATLQHTTNGRQSLSPTSEEGSVQIGHMLPRFPGQWKSRGYDSQRELKALRKFSTEHPALPPSALGGPTLHTLEHAGAPAEAVAHQMADILRDVEAKVQRIEVSLQGSLFSFVHSRKTRIESNRGQHLFYAPISSGRLLKLTGLGWKRNEKLNPPTMSPSRLQSRRQEQLPRRILLETNTTQRTMWMPAARRTPACMKATSS